ncbi:MAG TPA: hypothetical protein VFY29_14890 [Terriglobia bacterium]|nr:hypothetical protein [Terriglobia bacterium]
MDRNENIGRMPSPEAINREIARVEEMLVALTEKIDSASGKLKSSIQLQVCRAELRAYWAGLLFALGYNDMLETRRVCPDLNMAAPAAESIARDAVERRRERAKFN